MSNTDHYKRLTKIVLFIALTATPAWLAQAQAIVTSTNTDGKINIFLNDQAFTSFCFKDTPLTHFYPIIGPTGATMTRGYPMEQGLANESKDHPHHQSLWFAHGNLDGYDFWHHGKPKSGKIKTNSLVTADLGFIAKEAEAFGLSLAGLKPDVPIVRHDEQWWGPDEENLLMIARSYFAFDESADESRVIDVLRVHMVPLRKGEVTFGDTKEGTMAFRSHPALRLKGEAATGKAINSNGDKDAKVWGKRAKWVAYWGDIDGKTCGFAIFDHPTNLRHPTWWHARDYGLVAANPFGISDFERGKHEKGAGKYTLKEGEHLNLRYRFVFFAGTAEEADIAGKYDQWVKDTTEQQSQQVE